MNEQDFLSKEETVQEILPVGIPDSIFIGVSKDSYENRDVDEHSARSFLTSKDGLVTSVEKRNKIAENFFEASLKRAQEVARFLVESGDVDVQDVDAQTSSFIEIFKKTYQMVEIESFALAVTDGVNRAVAVLPNDGKICLFKTKGVSGELFSQMTTSLLEDQKVAYYQSSNLESDIENIAANDVVLVTDDVAYSGLQLGLNLSILRIDNIRAVVSLGAITEEALEFLESENRDILFAEKLSSIADLLENESLELIKLVYCYFFGEKFELWRTKKLPDFSTPQDLDYFNDEKAITSLTHLIANLPDREQMLEELKTIRAAYTPFKIPDPMSMDSLFAEIKKPNGDSLELFHQTLSLYPGQLE